LHAQKTPISKERPTEDWELSSNSKKKQQTNIAFPSENDYSNSPASAQNNFVINHNVPLKKRPPFDHSSIVFPGESSRQTTKTPILSTTPSTTTTQGIVSKFSIEFEQILIIF